MYLIGLVIGAVVVVGILVGVASVAILRSGKANELWPRDEWLDESRRTHEGGV